MTDDLAEAKRHIRALIDLDDDQRYAEEPSDAYLNAMAFLSRLDAEGQTVEGGENLPCPICGDLPKEQDYREHTDQTGEVDGYASVSCVASDHNVLCDADNLDEARKAWNRRAELTRLKAAQPEHDRTVRLAALEEAACAIDAAERPESGFHHFIINGFEHAIADAVGIVRALKDQTGGEGGI